MTREQKLAYHREYNKRWYAANKNRRTTQILEWRANHQTAYDHAQLEYRATEAAKTKRNAAAARYKQTERGRIVNRSKASRRRARAYDTTHEAIDYSIVLARHGYICGICGRRITRDFHIDHIVALSLGGGHTFENLQPAHPKCNQLKGGHETHERRRWLF